jgi:hypothetical protein
MLKADPRRREWEQAPLWMRCTCGEEGELADARRLEAFEDRLQKATEWREQANGVFQKVSESAFFYSKILSALLSFRPLLSH